jgi:hypothetical protein
MQDLPWDAPIPEHVPLDNSIMPKIQAAHDRLVQLLEMLPTEAEDLSRLEYLSAKTKRQEMLKAAKVRLVFYNEMMTKVKAWQAPTPEHENFKEFLVQELLSSIAVDCDTKSLGDEPAQISGEIWREYQIKLVRAELEYLNKAQAHADTQAFDDDAWLARLRLSLDPTCFDSPKVGDKL